MIEVRVREASAGDGPLLGHFDASDLPALVKSFIEYGFAGLGSEWTGQFEKWAGDKAVFALLYDENDER